MLDARDPAKRVRERGDGLAPAHVPYLKHVAGDASNPAHFTAKAAWRFEAVDNAGSGPVAFRTPYRLRHVASDKYLAVDSAAPTDLQDNGGGGGGSGGGDRAEDRRDLYTAALVDGVDLAAGEGELGSPASLLFYLVPTDSSSTDALGSGVTTVRLEHRSPAAGALYFLSAREPKPLLPPLSASNDAGATATPVPPRRKGPLDRPGGRLLFSSEPSSIDVLKVLPLAAAEAQALDRMKARVRFFRLFAALAQCYDPLGAGTPPAERAPHLMLCHKVVGACLDLLKDLVKGADAGRPRYATEAEAMKDANGTLPAVFAGRFAGEPNGPMQRVAVDCKVMDAVFDAAVASYNRALWRQRPFEAAPFAEHPRAVQKFLYVAVQRCLHNNRGGQAYFAARAARSWYSPGGGGGGESQAAAGRAPAAPPLGPAVRQWVLWRDLVIAQGEDALGATVTLSNLLAASGAIVKKLVNNELLERFKGLVAKCGPEPRLLNLFTATCFVEGRPSSTNQEMCLRKLWMTVADRYAFGATFHEQPGAAHRPYGPIELPSGQTHSGPHARAPASSPGAYLGKRSDNTWDPVAVAWTGAPRRAGGCGRLFWDAEGLGLGAAGTRDSGDGAVGALELVPIDQLLWALEPERLCGPVTGSAWVPFADEAAVLARKLGRGSRRGAAELSAEEEAEAQEKRRAGAFRRQQQLAGYLVAQMKLLAAMCAGRAYNSIAWLERSFSYELLLNMASNPRLPHVFRSAVVDFAIALYVDRFPQVVGQP